MLSTMRSITASMSKLNFGLQKPLASIQCQSFLSNNEPVNTVVPNRGLKKFPGFKRNWPEFHHYMREKRHHYAKAYLIPKTRSPRFPGHIDVFGRDGKRESLEAASLRFKRLDMGSYITTQIGKKNKAHQKTPWQKADEEQHVFAPYDFYKKLDRMFNGEDKAKRYLPDDIYEKYNKISWLKYSNSVYKNSKLIEKYGNKVYKFDRYRMHMDKVGPANRQRKEMYAPPGFLKTIKDNGGVFKPEGENVYHEPDWMAPHFQRTPIREPDFIVKRKNYSKVGFQLDNNHLLLRRGEKYYKRLRPWSRVMHLNRY